MTADKIRFTELEFDILRIIEKHNGVCELKNVAGELRKSYVEILRAAQELSDKGFLTVETSSQKVIRLLPSGMRAVDEGLPERIAVEKIYNQGGLVDLTSLPKLLNTSEDEFKIILGWLRTKNWIKLVKKDGSIKVSVDKIPETGADELLLKHIRNSGEVNFEQLLRGVEVKQEISQLTSELIKSGRWRDTAFKKFEIASPVSRVYPGKLHPITALIEEIREIFLEFGFEEIESPLVENTFWNFDVLFVPQDHPARDAWDTFYL
ncbi:MAG: hypothetical protein QW739_03490, partial [Candidatus Odinarchaeota archaeon]